MNQIVKVEEEDLQAIALAPMDVDVNALVGATRAELDVQISTAHRFPRSIALAHKNISSLVMLDQESAEECFYALPRGGKPIQGPSIRLAEIVIQQWKNARSYSRVVQVDRVEKVVVAEGGYLDLEANVGHIVSVRRSIADKRGKIFSDDMITVTGNAACAIAKRNAILTGIPKAIWNKAYKDALQVVAGTIQTLSVSRDKAIAAFANFGVKPEQIFPAIGVGGLEEITLEHIPVLRGMFSAIKNGEATVEEMFDPRKAPSTHERVADPLSDKEPEHDRETGEIKQAADKADGAVEGSNEQAPADTSPLDQGGAVGGSGDGKQANQPATGTASPEKIALLKELQPKARKGVAALNRALGGLSKERHTLLGQDDLDALRDMAEAGGDA